MSKNRKTKDPFAKREAENYDNPIPSREFILQHLEEVGEPVSHETVCEQLKLTDEESVEALRRRLIAMSRDGQIISNRRGVYGLAAHMDLLKGRVQGNKDGFGFFIPEDGSGDLFLNGREMEKLFDGDQVLARVSGVDGRGRKEGAIVEILKRRFEQIVGRYFREDGFGVVMPDSKRVTHEILIPEKNVGKAEDGQFVVAEITEYPSRRRKAIGRIVEVLGDSATPGVEIDIALRSHDIPHEWPSAVSSAVKKFSDQVESDDLGSRRDMRSIPFVTIDGEDAKDFDDAVYAEPNKKGGWKLFVAIADVSHYVKIDSPLDEEAQNRATSVYFPGHVIPMLPEKLSNGLCSLKPEVDRLTMVCEMDISASGEMTSYAFSEAVIHSHGRLTYNEVADMVQVAETEIQEKIKAKMRDRYASIIPHIEDIYALYHALRAARDAGGAMDFDTTETRIVFGENKKIREIVPVFRNDAHRLIEECMLCANVAAAKLLESNDLPALYRIHEGPNPEKLDNLREFLKELGLYLPGGDKPEPGDYKKVLVQIADRPDRNLLQTLLIRSLMQAVYQPDNLGHFGLGYPAYTHFTSPIRRYPDLLVHRAIRFLIRNKKSKHLDKQSDAPVLSRKQIYPYSLEDMEKFGVNCSVAERRADAAGYDVMDWLKCEYMQDKIGDEFPATVTSVTSFGLFVELTDIFVEGLVHITELSNDYYHFDPVRHCLAGEHNGNTYRLGDTVQVKLMRVNMEEKKIDLAMVGMEPKAKPARKGKKKFPKDGSKSDKAANSAKKKASKKHKKSRQQEADAKVKKEAEAKAATNKTKKKHKKRKDLAKPMAKKNLAREASSLTSPRKKDSAQAAKPAAQKKPAAKKKPAPR